VNVKLDLIYEHLLKLDTLLLSPVLDFAPLQTSPTSSQIRFQPPQHHSLPVQPITEVTEPILNMSSPMLEPVVSPPALPVTSLVDLQQAVSPVRPVFSPASGQACVLGGDCVVGMS
jgi:hypothetical protein